MNGIEWFGGSVSHNWMPEAGNFGKAHRREENMRNNFLSWTWKKDFVETLKDSMIFKE